MAKTQIRTNNLEDGGVKRDDLNIATAGQAVVRKIVQGTGVTLSSTGADSGTGDVTINTSQDIAPSASPAFANETINGVGYHDKLSFKSENSFNQASSFLRFSLVLGSASGGVWYKIASVTFNSIYSIYSTRFSIDYSEDGVNYYNIRGKIRLRTNNPITSNNVEWFYDVIGHSGYSISVLSDLMRVVKTVDNGSVVTWEIWVYSPETWGNLGIEFSEYVVSVQPTWYKSSTSGTPGTSIVQSNRNRNYLGSGESNFGGLLKANGNQVCRWRGAHGTGDAGQEAIGDIQSGDIYYELDAASNTPSYGTDIGLWMYVDASIGWKQIG